MVVFTCNNCGDSLQKPKVEKHYQSARCGAGKNLTCVDCFKDFRDDEYVSHTKCLTEEERYAAKGSMPNGVLKKGECKQESWTQMIQGIIDKEENLSAPVRNVLNVLSNYVNIPRKKNKFMNFASSTMGQSYNQNLCEAVWELIEKHKAQQFPPKEENVNGATKLDGSGETTKRQVEETNDNVEAESDEPMKKKKKKEKMQTKLETKAEGNKLKTVIEACKFSFPNTILDILKTKKNMSLTKLHKKVHNIYKESKDFEEFTQRRVEKCLKSLNVQVVDDIVSLNV